MTASDCSVSDVVITRQNNHLHLASLYTGIYVYLINMSICVYWKIAPFIVEFTSNFNSCIFLGTNTPVKFVAKIARLFRGQIDPLIIFGRDILNFIAGLAQWHGLAQTLVWHVCMMLDYEQSLFFLPPSFLASRGFATHCSLMRVANWRKKRLLTV